MTIARRRQAPAQGEVIASRGMTAMSTIMRSPFASTQVDGLKIGSDTGTCFKVRV
jgi:hypothetical protein